MKRTKTQRHSSCRGNARSMFLSVIVDFGARLLPGIVSVSHTYTKVQGLELNLR